MGLCLTVKPDDVVELSQGILIKIMKQYGQVCRIHVEAPAECAIRLRKANEINQTVLSSSIRPKITPRGVV